MSNFISLTLEAWGSWNFQKNWKVTEILLGSSWALSKNAASKEKYVALKSGLIGKR